MSELFDDDPRNTPPAASPPRRSRALLITAVVLLVAFFGMSTFASLYTDRLWFHYAGYAEVFSTLFWTKTGLFLVFGALMALAVGLNMLVAYRLRPMFRPHSPEQTGLDRYRDAVTPIRTLLLVGVSVVVGLFAGSSGAGQWRSYLLWRNGGSFDSRDAYFKKDIGFYVFDLPWLHYLVDFVMAATVVALLAAALVHYLYGGVRLQAAHDRLSGAAQAQLSVLLGVFVLAKGGDYWLDRYDLVHQGGQLITGMTYADQHAVLPAKNILMGIAVICAVLFFLNVWRRTWLLPSVGLALLALSAVLLGLIWPGVVQQFQVKPSEADKEEPYIAANIRATRSAYDLTNVKVELYTSNSSAATGQLDALSQQTSSTPLVDPKLVRQTFEQNQQARAYYSVAPVLDVDRYRIRGADRALVLGVRELDQSGLDPADQNWSNLHTVYTHGNGVIAAYANQRPADNRTEATSIQWAEGQPTAGLAAGAARARQLRVAGLLRRAQPELLGGRAGAREARRRARPRPGNVGVRGPGRPADHVQRVRRRAGGQLLQPVHVRREVRRAELPALGAGEQEQRGALQPQPARPGREGGAVADHRRRPVPGRGERPDRVGARRLHDHRPVPVLAAGVVPDDDQRLAADDAHRAAHAADRRGQLHAQRGQGDRGRLRRHGHALRLGRQRPDPLGLAPRLPGHGEGQEGHPVGACSRTCATPRTCSRCSATSSRATT